MGESRPKIAISGATGLLGRALEVRLRTQKYAAERLVRRRDFDGIYWDPVGRAIEGRDGRTRERSAGERVCAFDVEAWYATLRAEAEEWERRKDTANPFVDHGRAGISR